MEIPQTNDPLAEGALITNPNEKSRANTSEHSQAYDAMRRLAAIVDSSADAILSKDLDGTILTWNPGAERLYGYTREEAIGRSVLLIMPKDRAQELALISARLRHGECVAMETERLRKDGKRIAVALTVSPIRDDAGHVASASVIAHDVTRRNIAREDLRDKEQHLQAILNTAADAIITINDNGVIQSVNSATERMFGYTAKEMLDQNITMLVSAPYRDQLDGYLETYWRTNEKHILGKGRELVHCRKDGSCFPGELAVGEWRAHGRHMFTGVVRDISARKALERQVLDAAASEQNRLGQELHDTVAQELTALGLLAASLLPNESAPVDAALVAKLAKGIRSVLSNVRAIAHGLASLELEATGLPAALDDLVALTNELHSVSCTLNCREPVKLADKQTATQLLFIAREAVTNALKHAHAQNIHISLAGDEHWFSLRVQDNGIGLPESPTHADGMGLNVMHFRSGLINAVLTVERAKPTGTIVTCTRHEVP